MRISDRVIENFDNGAENKKGDTYKEYGSGSDDEKEF